MASNLVYYGPWRDYSQPLLYGLKYTMSPRNGAVCTNALALFIQMFVMAWFWNFCKLCLHQNFIPGFNYQNDAIEALLRLVWRNTNDPFSAMCEIVAIYWAWKPWSFFQRPSPGARRSMKRSGPDVPWLWLRILIAFGVTLLIYVGFTAASLLSANIVVSDNRVLLASGPPGTCGEVNTTLLLDWSIKIRNETLAAQSYVQSCYSGQSPGSCSSYVVPSLPYYTQQYDSVCPFGPEQNFLLSPCNATNNPGSYVMTTGMVDSNDHLGINAPKEDRVLFNVTVTCSVVNSNNYKVPFEVRGNQAFDIGAVQNMHGVTNYTYIWDPVLVGVAVEYQTTPYFYQPDAPTYWLPVNDFLVPNSDIYTIFLAQNSVSYASPVMDPFFYATNSTTKVYDLHERTVFEPTPNVKIMGCAAQFQICKDQDNCMSAGGVGQLFNGLETFGFNSAQAVTAHRLINMFSYSDIYSNVYGSGQNALLASQSIFQLLSEPLPDNQWTIEVLNWFKIGLAKMQAFAVAYPNNGGQVPPGSQIIFPYASAGNITAYEAQCHNQIIHGSGQEVTISLFGVIFIFLFGALILVIHQGFPFWVKRYRKKRNALPNSTTPTAEDNYKADGIYVLWNATLRSRNRPVKYWKHGIPVYENWQHMDYLAVDSSDPTVIVPTSQAVPQQQQQAVPQQQQQAVPQQQQQAVPQQQQQQQGLMQQQAPQQQVPQQQIPQQQPQQRPQQILQSQPQLVSQSRLQPLFQPQPHQNFHPPQLATDQSAIPLQVLNTPRAVPPPRPQQVTQPLTQQVSQPNPHQRPQAAGQAAIPRRMVNTPRTVPQPRPQQVTQPRSQQVSQTRPQVGHLPESPAVGVTNDQISSQTGVQVLLRGAQPVINSAISQPARSNTLP